METSYQGSFSATLQQYFARKGNRIVFSNGMTLNELALAMWERLGYRGIDASVLSRVLSGERVFTLRQVEIFAKILHMPSEMANDLREALISHIGARFGISDYLFGRHSVYRRETIEENIRKIFQVTEEAGSPYLALDWCLVLEEKLESEIKGAKEDKERYLLLRYLSKLIQQKTNIFSHIQGAREFYRTTLVESNRLRYIARLTNNRKILGLAETRLSSALYILGSNRESLKIARMGLKDNAPKENQIMALRESAICLSKLKKAQEFLSVRKQLQRRIPYYSWYYKFEVYEGLARAEANLGNFSGGYENLDLARKALSKTPGTMRNVQLIAAELELAQLSKTKTEKSYLEKIGEEGLFLAREHGYQRHGEKIRKYLDNILNQ